MKRELKIVTHTLLVCCFGTLLFGYGKSFSQTSEKAIAQAAQTVRTDSNLSGRYEGMVRGNRPDGTPAERKVFFIVREDKGRFYCSGSVSSFDEQSPCTEVSLQNGHLKAFMEAWADGIFLDLKVDSRALTGTLIDKAGKPATPFQIMEVKRVGDLTLTDLIPRLRGESVERSPRLLQLRKDIIDGKPEALQAFWSEVQRSGAPLIEPVPNSAESYLVTFLWRGSAETKSVLVFWPRFALARADDFFMLHLEGSDLWFKTMRMQRGTRIYYQLSPNDPLQERPMGDWPRQAQADPLNPKRDRDDPKLPLQRVRSLLELPGALPQPWYVKREGVPRYAVIEQKIKSEKLKSERKILVYTPPGYSVDAKPYASLYLFDGEDPDGAVFATWTLENLIAARQIPPLVVIRIANPNQVARQNDLSCNDTFTEFLNAELVPFIRKNYHVSKAPAQTIIGGYSLGGLAATYAGFRHTETFGLILSQSGSYWYEPTQADYAEPNWLARQFAQVNKLPLRFYLDAGSYELDFSGKGLHILIPNRHFRDVLRAKGYEVHYQEFPGEHEQINWRGTFADGLIALTGLKK
jgi:enterochelin esterase-like enzyme